MAWAALAAAPIALTIAAATAPLRVARPPCFPLRHLCALGPGAHVSAAGRMEAKLVVMMTAARAGASAVVDLQPMLGRAARGDRGARRHADPGHFLAGAGRNKEHRLFHELSPRSV